MNDLQFKSCQTESKSVKVGQTDLTAILKHLFMEAGNNFQTTACNPCQAAAVCHDLISMLPNSGGNFIQNGLCRCLSGGKYGQVPLNDES